MERMINNRLNWWCEVSLGLPISQFGFRRNKSCIDNLAILQSGIFLAKEQNQFTAAMFLDIKAAYNNVLIDILLEKLARIGFPNEILAFIQNLVYSRKVICRFEKIDEIRWSFKDLPQGSVLSPLLYNIYVSELEECCPSDCHIIQYVDDISIFTNNNNDKSAIILKNTMHNIKNKLTDLGLSLLIEKTKFCIFDLRSKSRIRTKKVIKIDNMDISSSNYVRFLGVNLSSKWDWNS